MTSVDTSESTTGSPPVQPGEMRLEVVVLAVSDVDRAKAFYEGLGWRLDADLAVDDGYRVVQLTPPGSGLLDHLRHRTHLGRARLAGGPAAAPSTTSTTARADLIGARCRGQRAVPRRDRASSTTPAPTGAWTARLRDTPSYGSFASFSDPDGNGWLLQEIKTRLPGR